MTGEWQSNRIPRVRRARYVVSGPLCTETGGTSAILTLLRFFVYVDKYAAASNATSVNCMILFVAWAVGPQIVGPEVKLDYCDRLIIIVIQN